MIREQRPDVAVLDLRLATLDAVEVHELAALEDPDLARRIMILTADPTSDRAEEARDAMDGPAIGKDASRGKLVDAIAAYAARLRAGL